MKASDTFKTIIEDYLQAVALKDSAFAQSLSKDSKNIDSCLDYIGSEVKKTGLCAFVDQEIFDMAVKYYNDDTISAPLHTAFREVVHQPAKADLFSPLVEPFQTTTPKTAVAPTPKTPQTTLTLFDL